MNHIKYRENYTICDDIRLSKEHSTIIILFLMDTLIIYRNYSHINQLFNVKFPTKRMGLDSMYQGLRY